MALIARPARPGQWVDFSVWPSDEQLQAFLDRGVVGCLVYGPLPGVSEAQKIHDLTSARLQTLTGMGFDVLLVQHCRYPGWDPRMHSGIEDADAIAGHALKCGYPDHAHIYEDWEGVSAECPASEGTRFLEEWANRLSISPPFGAALYVGYQQPLNPDQLYALRRINSYGSDEGHRRVSKRGVAFHQGTQIVLDGAIVDLDEVAADQLGELPIACATSEPG